MTSSRRKIPVKLQVGKTYLNRVGEVMTCVELGGLHFKMRDVHGAEYWYTPEGLFVGMENDPKYTRHIYRPEYKLGESYYTRDLAPVHLTEYDEDCDTYQLNGEYTLDGRYYTHTESGYDLMDYEGGVHSGAPALEPEPAVDPIVEAACAVESTAPSTICVQCPGAGNGCCGDASPGAEIAKTGYVITATDADEVWKAYLMTLGHRLPTHADLLEVRASIMASVGEVLPCE